jgi:hypothetical protein
MFQVTEDDEYATIYDDEQDMDSWTVRFDLTMIMNTEKVRKLAQYCADVLNEGD